jgi:glycosyltransferase involved in cell wall biosynthesis
VPELHRLADIFVLPSIATRTVQEQFGMVLIEAMATGKPVLATRCGAIDEVVGPAGLLVQANDCHRLAEGLHTLISRRDLREQYGEQALARVWRLFSHEAISTEIAAAYGAVLAKAQAPAPIPTAQALPELSTAARAALTYVRDNSQAARSSPTVAQ